MKRSIEKSGEVRQQGMGATWWERSLVMAAQAGRAVRETVLDSWTKMLQSRQPGRHHIPPQDRGPDLGR